MIVHTIMLAPTVRPSWPIGVIARLHKTSLSSAGRAPHFATPMRPGKLTSKLRPYSCKTSKPVTGGPPNRIHGVKAAAPTSVRFWTSAPLWRRASINTLRCLAGCTSGDFSAMWLLQTFYPEIGIGAIMGVAMVSGLTTSILLETILLRYGRDQFSWPNAARTAAGMSFISMLTMEAAQNMVDYHLTGGVVAFDSPAFWAAAVISMGAGFITPLPYNYLRLKKYGKACH
ncbi:hypothetical protein F4803DRAFT_522230 [Xylaria telfairii]|nr:hypothetical protein F4803DRAFT_522230 [Xylaria telfairii]